MCYAQLMDDILTAIEYGDIETLRSLLKNYTDWNRYVDRFIFENTAIHIATAHCDIPIISLLLSRGFVLHGLDEQGYHPMHIAAMNGALAVVKQLLNAKADIEVKDTANTAYVNGRTPLFFAVERGHSALVQYLLDRGADINAKDSLGRTPLFQAVVWKNATMTQQLLKNGASIHFKGHNHRTVLHEITSSPFMSYEIVKLLTYWGADWEEQDNTGQTAYLFLVERKKYTSSFFYDQNKILHNIEQFLNHLFDDIRQTYQLEATVPTRIISYFLRVHPDWRLLAWEVRNNLTQCMRRNKIPLQLPPEIQDVIITKSLLNTMQDHYGIAAIDGQQVMDHFFWKFQNKPRGWKRYEASNHTPACTQHYGRNDNGM